MTTSSANKDGCTPSFVSSSRLVYCLEAQFNVEQKWREWACGLFLIVGKHIEFSTARWVGPVRSHRGPARAREASLTCLVCWVCVGRGYWILSNPVLCFFRWSYFSFISFLSIFSILVFLVFLELSFFCLPCLFSTSFFGQKLGSSTWDLCIS